MSFGIELFMFLTPELKLSLAAIYTTREEAEKALLSEFPAGHKIFPNYRIVRVRVEILGDR